MRKLWLCLIVLPALVSRPAGSCTNTYVYSYSNSMAVYDQYGNIYCGATGNTCIASGCNGPGTHCVDDGINSYCIDYQY